MLEYYYVRGVLKSVALRIVYWPPNDFAKVSLKLGKARPLLDDGEGKTRFMSKQAYHSAGSKRGRGGQVLSSVRILSTCPLARVGLALKRFCDVSVWRVELGNNRVSPVNCLREILMEPTGNVHGVHALEIAEVDRFLTGWETRQD